MDFDSTAQAALVEPAVAPAWFIYLDIDGDPLRVTTFGGDVLFVGTGDIDLDGFTFTAFAGSLLDVGDVSHSESGSDTLNITLSGIVDLDTDLIAAIGDKSLWQGRTARIWTQLYDESGVTPQGAIARYNTGWMSSVRIVAAPTGQVLQLSVESYLAYTTQASNRDYLSQKNYDAADTSAAATMTAANGLRRNTGAQSGGSLPQTVGEGGYLGRRVDIN